MKYAPKFLNTIQFDKSTNTCNFFQRLQFKDTYFTLIHRYTFFISMAIFMFDTITKIRLKGIFLFFQSFLLRSFFLCMFVFLPFDFKFKTVFILDTRTYHLIDSAGCCSNKSRHLMFYYHLYAKDRQSDSLTFLNMHSEWMICQESYFENCKYSARFSHKTKREKNNNKDQVEKNLLITQILL